MTSIKQHRFFSIEALRGLSSLGVAWLHLTGVYPLDAVGYSGRFLGVGVYVFFVISGFIIPYSLYATNYRVSAFPRFIARRMVRLEPPYIISILVAIVLWNIASMTSGYHGPPPSYTFPQIAAHLFYLIPFTSYDWIEGVYWTLFCEFVFYISAGLLFPIIARGNILVITAIFTAVFAVTSIIVGPFEGHGGPAVVFLFLIGIAGFRYFTKEDRLVTFLCVSTSAAAAIAYFEPEGGTLAAIAGLAAIAVILFVEIPNCKIFSFFGAISYSLYLLHAPLGSRIVNLGRRFGDAPLYEFGVSFFALLVCVTAATAYWYWIERPALLASKKISIESFSPRSLASKRSREQLRT
jgi:peptidoglycan/LPS O-acetylase OafA/YrhL